MEGGDIYKASNSLRGSLRAGSSSIWRNSGVDVFSRSSRDEDDEEALKWAAIEKLPTVARLRKGILTGSQGGADEIDVSNLGLQERRTILERLVRVAEEDNERFLLKLKNRINRVGIDLPTIEVRFENLKIEAEAFVGTNALPSVLNFTTGVFENFLIDMGILSSKKKKLTILKDVSGIIKSGRMTLLLGPPSSGKTTLLLALAGKLDPALKFSGAVTYNGHSMNEFVPQRTAAYISQHDLHLGEMTVRETLAFSARCQGVGTRYDMLAELSRREKEANIKPDPDVDVFMKAVATEGQEANVITDYILKILGLDVCADTMVGNEMLRGISGGQRKRVTTGGLVGFVLLFNFGYTLALTFLNPLEKNRAVISDESESNDLVNEVGVGGGIQLTSQENNSSHVNRSEIQDDIQKSTSPKSFSLSDATVGATGKRKKGMVLPFEQHSLTFDDIVYSVDMPQEMKEQGVTEDRLVLLKGVSGAFRPGVLTALMGVSGAVDTETRKMFIEEVMELVELKPLRHALVGIPGDTILNILSNILREFKELAKSKMATIQQLGCWKLPLFWDLGSKTKKMQDLLNAMGSMYAAVLFIGIQNSASVQPVVAVERTVFYRERAAGMYSAMPYAIAQVLIEIPYIFVQASDSSSHDLVCQYGGDDEGENHEAIVTQVMKYLRVRVGFCYVCFLI
ncbi:hypothetical protein V6N13_138709 [Hibiscus sabdariffa]